MSDIDELDPKSRGLGRGLNALFEDDEDDMTEGFDTESPNAEGSPISSQAEVAVAENTNKAPMKVGIDQIHVSALQPRKNFDEEALGELAASIKEHGVLQPLLVREDGGGYEIIAGERRWRASQLAQLHEVPVIVLELDDLEAFKVALIENLQREDLDPIEEAAGYQKLQETYGQSQDELAKSVGKSRSHVANMIRLLSLPEKVQGFVSDGKLSMGHARTLITAEEPEVLAKKIIDAGLSVRQAEKLAADTSGRERQERPRSSSKDSRNVSREKDPDTLALENDMSNILGMRVTIDSKDGASGALKVEFKSLDQLDELLHRLAHYPGSRQSG